MHKLILSLLISLFVLHSFGQNKQSIVVSIEGANDNDTVTLYSNRNIKDTSFIKNKQARFSLAKMGDEWDTYFIDYGHGDKRLGFPLFGNNTSAIQLSVDKELTGYTITGDANAKEQNEFWQGGKAVQKHADSLAKQQSDTKDSVGAQATQSNVDSAEKVFRNYAIAWILKHKTSPYSAAVVRMFIDRANILNALDTVAVNCYNALDAQAKANNYESDLLLEEFARYDDMYSKVPPNSKAPDFLIKDTAGHSISLATFKGKWVLIDFWASWCGPCRRNNPLLTDFYNTYHKKGLDILSVSVDTNSEPWKKAIKKDNMT